MTWRNGVCRDNGETEVTGSFALQGATLEYERRTGKSDTFGFFLECTCANFACQSRQTVYKKASVV